MEEIVLDIKDLSKTYSGVCVLDSVSFTLKKGTVHALVGENGAGKSTMIKAVSGAITPDPGYKIIVDGVVEEKMTTSKSIAYGISVIYQDISLFSNLSIAENICKGLFPDKFFNKKKYQNFAREKLKEFGIELDVKQNLKDISIGKQQLVAIVRAITFKAKIIIMDEPTSALSGSEVDKLYEVIRSLKERGTSIIYISHKMDEIFALADEITVLRDGKHIISGKASDFTHKSLIHYMVGRELLFETMRNQEGKSGITILKVEDFTYEPYFRNMSFEIQKFEIVGITGLVGAGRSELAQTIFGLNHPFQGKLYLHGKQIKVKNANDAIKNGICYLPEDKHTQGLFKGHSVKENISVVTLNKILNNIHLLDDNKETQTTEQYIKNLSIRPPFPDALVESFSGGNQQKVLLARWLNAEPKVLIVDEPTIGVDVGAKAEIHRFLRKLASEGVAVLLISSDLPEVMALSDRIIVMKAGEIVSEVNTEDATQESILHKGLLGK